MSGTGPKLIIGFREYWNYIIHKWVHQCNGILINLKKKRGIVILFQSWFLLMVQKLTSSFFFKFI